MKQESLNLLLTKIVDNKWIYSAVMCIENGDRSFTWTGAAGTLQKDNREIFKSL